MEPRIVFPKPTTGLNKALERAMRLRGPSHAIDEATLARWRDASFASYSRIVPDIEALERVVHATEWNIVQGPAPSNTWFGEFSDGDRPRVDVYADSLTTRFPARWLFELGGQTGIDHMFGHLYPYHRGDADFGEEVACRYQHLATKARGGAFWGAVARCIPLAYSLHKEIPLSNYR